MSDGHIYLIRFGGQPHFFPHSSLYPFSLSSIFLPRRAVFFLAGDVTRWHLPVGMKDLNLAKTKVTGKATSE
jgi:hypothetical protein